MDIFAPPSKSKPISLTPLIDMVFLLVVFFMLTATFHKNEGIELSFSSSEKSSAFAGDFNSIVIAIDGQSNILVDDAKYGIVAQTFSATTPDDFIRMIQALLSEDSNRQFQLYIIGKANIQHVIHTIELLHRAGGRNISFIHDEE